mgnify:FL=1
MKTILIIEDEERSREALIRKIRQYLGNGIEVDVAGNGLKGVKRAMVLHPDLIFMDVEMPVMDGLEASVIINRQLSTARIVFLTAYDKFQYVVEAMRSGAKDYLLKPVQENELHRILDVYIGKSRDKESRPETFETALDVWLEHHYAESLNMEVAATAVGMTTPYFSKKVKAVTGVNFSEHLANRRMDRAKEYLRTTELPIAEISAKVGYVDSRHFTKVFKKRTGMTPGSYRQVYHSGAL